MGEGKEENAIVTSTGEYVVAWDFAKVKKGQLDKYEIKKCVCHSPSPSASTCHSTPLSSCSDWGSQHTGVWSLSY